MKFSHYYISNFVMKMSENSQLVVSNFFKPYLFILKIFCYFPSETDDIFKLLLYKLYSFTIMYLIMGLCVIMEVLYLINALGNLENMINGSVLLATDIGQLGKLYCLLKENKRIKSMLKHTNADVFQVRNEHQGIIIIKSMNRARLIINVYLSFGITTSILWDLSPIADRSDNSTLPLTLWFPFDTSRSPIYELSYTYESVALILHSVTNICKDSIPVLLMAFISGQLDALQDILHNLKNYTTNYLELEQTSENIGREMNKTLIESINRHRAIIR